MRDDADDADAVPEETIDRLNCSSDEELLDLSRSGAATDDLSAYAHIWLHSRAPTSPDTWADVAARTTNRRARHRTHGQPFRWPLVAAAAAMLVVGLGLGSLMTDRRWERAVATQPVLISTVAGMRSDVVLPDGSTVQLNAGSLLSYTASRGRSLEVTLEGEAFFRVATDSSRTFVVRTSEGTVRVYGTAFNVRSRDGRVAVAVSEGSVGLEAAGIAIRLQAGERAEATAGNRPSAVQPIEPAAAGAWLHGRIVFHDEPLPQAAEELERRFALTVVVDEALGHHRITATIPAQNATQALRAICMAVDGRCTPTDTGWRISRAPAARP